MNELMLFKVANQLSSNDMSDMLNIRIENYLQLEKQQNIDYTINELLLKYTEWMMNK